MQKLEMTCPYVVGSFEKHLELKSQLLYFINSQSNFQHLTGDKDNINITRCDWNTSRFDSERNWVKSLIPELSKHLQSTIKMLGYDKFMVREIWFQQYDTNAKHGWHSHGSNWTNVYYLELPDGSPKTQMLHPFTKEVIEFDVKEGDILTFPSFVIHRAPVNLCNKRKTIISWNMDTEVGENY